MREKFFGFLIFCFLFLMSRSLVFALDGPHILPNEKGECAVCHIPHNANGDKIWANDLKDLTAFGGVRQLCFSCHDGTETFLGTQDYNEDYGLPGVGNVFRRSTGADHVMHGGACLEPGPEPKADSLRDESNPEKYKDAYEEEYFPTDPNDVDKVPDFVNGKAHKRSGMNYKEGKEGWGFYCGSCHDVHRDGGGAYLRYKENYVGDDKKGDPAVQIFSVRKTFCAQCHSVPHAEDRDCMECHAPHRGATPMAAEVEEIARWILLEEVGEVEFASIGAVFPNEINKFPNETPFAEKPSVCYGCHRQGSAYGNSIATISADKCFHHPMGLFAEKSTSPRADGTYNAQRGADYPGVGAWDRNGQLDCLSCHTYHKVNEYCEKGDNNSYLRWNFKNDSPDFCVKCHDDKTDLDRLGKGTKDDHRQAKSTSYTNREVFVDDQWKTVISKDCMFCHYIHDGKTDNRRDVYDWSTRGISLTNLSAHQPGDDIPPELDALMRVPAKILPREWSDADDRENQEPKYYEDMCYGCHGNESIVIKEGEGGSLLRPDKYFSHRYAVDPKDGKNPNSNMIVEGALFPVSDGDLTGVVDDYGVEKGHMYCGSCHNVHDTSISPYLNGKPERHEPYRAYTDPADGFCQGCHQGDYPDEPDWINKTHPVSKGISTITNEKFYKNFKYREGGDGKKGAVFDNLDTSGEADIICLSCHNVHAAMTSWDGTKAKNNFDNPSSDKKSVGHGMLLVIDNNIDDGQKSDMCIQCHPM